MSEPARPKAVSGGERRRWYVHLALITSLAGSLLSLIYLSHSITIHVVFGVAFMFMMLFHLFQRRRTVKSLLKRLVGAHARARASTRLALSDIILELLVLNVLVSGIVDGVHHQATQMPFAATIGLPPGLSQWHKLAAFVLVIYATVHIIRRRKRLRRSHIQ
jgi:predicted PurR-regulated permease PerM